MLIKKILIKLRFIDFFTTELEIDKDDFIKELKNHVEEGYIGFFSLSLDGLSSSKKVFKGHVRDNSFKIRRRFSFFDMNHRETIARGVFKQMNNKLIIETEILGFHGIKFFLYFFLLIILLILFSIVYHTINLFISSDITLGEKFGIILINLIQLLMIIGIPYLVYNKSRNALKNEITRMFHNMQRFYNKAGNQ